jgi:hypothetical protein
VRKITFGEQFSSYSPDGNGAAVAPAERGCCHEGDVCTVIGHVRPRQPCLTLGLLLAQFAAGFASAEPGTPEQKRACTPDVYRLCPGEIPNVRAITACLRRQKASLSEAWRAVFEQ